MTVRIEMIHGPNLNLLGTREPHIYGHATLADVEANCRALLPDGFTLTARQSNHEGEIVGWVQTAREEAFAVIINPGAYAHTSIALLDALKAFEGPVIEVHVSNVHRRESFRHHSYVALRADGVIAGFGIEGYEAAVRRVVSLAREAGQA